MSASFSKLRVAPEIECSDGWRAIVPDRGHAMAYQKDIVAWAMADGFASSADDVASRIVEAFNAYAIRIEADVNGGKRND